MARSWQVPASYKRGRGHRNAGNGKERQHLFTACPGVCAGRPWLPRFRGGAGGLINEHERAA
jgi:hypothetical protein